MPENPPVPPGTRIWSRPVSPDMTAWARSIVGDPFGFPIFAQSTKLFGSTLVLARVEWHEWTFRNGRKITGTFRGVTLYEVLTSANTAVEGIDISHHQGRIDWPKVAASGKVFAFIKATEGTGFIDHTFSANWTASKAAGLLRGAYHFFRPAEDALAQAELFLAQIGDRGELPPTLDVEVFDGIPAPEIARKVSIWVEHVASNYERPLLYTNPATWNALPSVGVETKADLWIAALRAAPPEPFAAWNQATFWQYGEEPIPGIAGPVDLDRFQGSLDEFHAYLTRTGDGSPPAPPSFALETLSGIQQALNHLGAQPPLGVDGVFGPRTRAMVMAFQKAHRLAADGIVGPKTLATLRSALAP